MYSTQTSKSPNQKTMTKMFCFDYWVKGRENPLSSEGKKADPAKYFPYMAFLYMRPSNTDGENVKGESKWSLTEWTNHVAKELTRFMTRTKRNPTMYNSFKFPTAIKIKTFHQTNPLMNEFLDGAVVEVICNLYDVTVPPRKETRCRDINRDRGGLSIWLIPPQYWSRRRVPP